MSIGKWNPVAWTEGMFLRPQHLQQLDVSADARLRYHLHALNPFHWGVRKLGFDEEALISRRVVVSDLEAVLRDGTVLRMPGNATIESRLFEPGRERLDVHLGLRALSASEPNLSEGTDGPRHARYRSEEAELHDLARGGPPSPVDLLVPNLRILLSGDENELGLYESIKIAEIEATDDSKRPWRYSRRYVPPLLAVQASPVLADDCAKVASLVASRLRTAAGLTKNFTIDSVPRLFMRYTLARTAPLLRHWESTGETPPFALYTALVELAGALAAYRFEEAADLPLYDHENLYLCYSGLLQFISARLDEMAPENWKRVPMPFEPAAQAYATKDLTVQDVDRRNAFYLAIRAPEGVEAKDLTQRVKSEAKVASLKQIGAAVRHNLPGIAIERLPGAPTEIQGMAGYAYFGLDPNGKDWLGVRDDFSLALSLGRLQNASVYLYVAYAAEKPA